MFKKHALILGMISMGLAPAMTGCGKNLPALTVDQKTTVQSTLDDMGRSYAAPQSMHTGVQAFQTREMQMSSIPANTANTSTPPAASSSQDADLTSMQQDLSQEMQSKHCAPSADTSGLTTSSQAPIQISGAGCPITMSFKMSVANQSSTGGTINFNWDYDVNSATYKALNDVDSIHLSGAFNSTFGPNNATVDGKITGTVHSQKTGAITMTLSMSGSANFTAGSATAASSVSSSNGQTEVDLVYPTFEADLKDVNKNGTHQYFLNSETITEPQYQTYLENMGSILPAPQAGTSNTGAAPAQVTSGIAGGVAGTSQY